MTLTFGFSSLGCPELSLEAVLDLAERKGIGAVELRALSGTTDLPRLFESKYGSPKELGSRVRGRRPPWSRSALLFDSWIVRRPSKKPSSIMRLGRKRSGRGD